MKEDIIGRKEEIRELERLYGSGKAEFVAVYGRRRVGKTFLVKQLFEKELVFSVAGLANEKTKQQLKNFYKTLQLYDKSVKTAPQDWLDAFDLLTRYLVSLGEGRKVILLDELPWMDTPRSGFISALEHFWNGWASMRKDIMLIVCGSVSSWIMDKLQQPRRLAQPNHETVAVAAFQFGGDGRDVAKRWPQFVEIRSG